MEELPSISKTEYLILKILMNHGPELYGLEMIELSQGKLRRGSIYTLLARLENKGFVDSEKEIDVQPGLTTQRRFFTISGEGERALNEWELSISELVGGF